jgi:osmotically-inducible protein OsmY
MPTSSTGGGGGGRGGSSGAFGQQLYYANVGGGTQTNNQTVATASTMKVPANYNSFGLKRDLPYQTVMGPTIGGTSARFTPNNGQLLAALRDTMAQSPQLTAGRNIQVSLNGGGVVVLQGYVDSPRDRRIAEGIMRVTPGVRDVQNDLAVRNPQNP